MTVFLIQATMNGREYTHYVCRERHNAERLAALLPITRPHLNPIRVVEHAIDELTARRVRWADDLIDPK